METTALVEEWVIKLPTQIPYDLMLTKWSSTLNPLLKNPITAGLLISDVNLSLGDNVINHLLGRKMQGWFLIDVDQQAIIYRSAPLNAKTLTLNSNAQANVSLWVF